MFGMSLTLPPGIIGYLGAMAVRSNFSARAIASGTQKTSVWVLAPTRTRLTARTFGHMVELLLPELSFKALPELSFKALRRHSEGRRVTKKEFSLPRVTWIDNGYRTGSSATPPTFFAALLIIIMVFKQDSNANNGTS